jgi:hypothetical protein
MNDIISLIGTIASIGSIPLGFYFFIKGKEEKRDKVKRDIVKVLLYQLNDSNLVSVFEIQSVINSKCRESKVSVDSIAISEIIDDLLSEIISNPLLQKESKRTFIANLKFLSHRILTSSDNVAKTETVTIEKLKDIDQEKLEIELQQAQEKVKKLDKSVSLSQIFGIITGLLGMLAGVFTITSDIFFNNDAIKELFRKNDFLTTIILGVGVSFLSATISYFIKKSKDKQND